MDTFFIILLIMWITGILTAFGSIFLIGGSNYSNKVRILGVILFIIGAALFVTSSLLARKYFYHKQEKYCNKCY